MSGRLKSYFYAILGRRAGLEFVQQGIEALQLVRDGKYIRQDCTLRIEDEAVVLILDHVNSNALGEGL